MSTTLPDPGSSPQQGRFELLRGLAPMLGRADALRVAAHVLLSLGAALAGSIAAVVLVPLIQPGHAPMFGGHVLTLPTSRGVLILILLASVASYALLRWCTAGLGASVTSSCAVKLRNGVHARLIDADLTALAGSTSAEIANVLTHNVELIVQGVGATLQLLVAGITTAISLTFAFWVSPVLTLALPPLAGLGWIASRFYGGEQARVNRQYIRDMTRLFWFSEDFPRRLRHVRSFEREDAEKSGYGAVSASLGDGHRRRIELVASGKLVMELLAAIGMAGIFLLAGRLQGVDQASLIAVGLLLGRLLPYLASSRSNLQQLHLAAPAFELWQRYANMDRVHREAMPADIAAAAQCVHIEHLRVTLPSLRFEIADLVLMQGEMTLIAGDSGIGKSSLADALAGMTAPALFAAKIGGRCVDFGAYRRFVRKGAYVGQGVRPWQRTVRECLLWAAPDATDDRLHGVLRDVGFDRRLCGVDGGLDMELQGASSRLSGGELQRLLLAQVILRQPFMSVLDEATAALDAVSEMNVLATLKRHLPQTILVVVSHRPGLVAIADQCLRFGRNGATTITRTEVRAAHANLDDRTGVGVYRRFK